MLSEPDELTCLLASRLILYSRVLSGRPRGPVWCARQDEHDGDACKKRVPQELGTYPTQSQPPSFGASSPSTARPPHPTPLLISSDYARLSYSNPSKLSPTRAALGPACPRTCFARPSPPRAHPRLTTTTTSPRPSPHPRPLVLDFLPPWVPAHPAWRPRPPVQV